jgi:hypothetical protein
MGGSKSKNSFPLAPPGAAGGRALSWKCGEGGLETQKDFFPAPLFPAQLKGGLVTRQGCVSNGLTWGVLDSLTLDPTLNVTRLIQKYDLRHTHLKKY